MSISLDRIPRKNIPLLLKTLPIEKIVQLCETCSEFEPFVESNRKDLKLETKSKLSVTLTLSEEKTIQYTRRNEHDKDYCHNPAHFHFDIIEIWTNIACSDPTETNCQDDPNRCLRQAQRSLKLSCNRLTLPYDLASLDLLSVIPCKHLHIHVLLDITTLQLIPETISSVQIKRAPDGRVPLSYLVRFEEIAISIYKSYSLVTDVEYYLQFFTDYRGQLRKLRLPRAYGPINFPNLVKLHEGKRFMEPCTFSLSLLDTQDGELLMVRQEQETIHFLILRTMTEVAEEVFYQLQVERRHLHEESFQNHNPQEDRWLKDRLKKKSLFRLPASVLLERLVAARREDYLATIKNFAEDRVTRNGVSLVHVVRPRQKRVPEPIDTAVMLDSRMRTKRKSSKLEDYDYAK